jgi:hypothetical protein
MSIRAAKAKLRIHEVPSHERNRLYGSSNLRAISDGWRILKVILQEKFGSKRQYKLEVPPELWPEGAPATAVSGQFPGPG